jgi:nucleoside-diphosphate-sugar epimerase
MRISETAGVRSPHLGGSSLRVFVTGGSGRVGSAVVPELVAAGHAVTGLARSDKSAAAIHAAGAIPVRGTIEDLAVLRSAASASDAVVHLAFPGDLARSGRMAEAVDRDVTTVRTLGGALPSGAVIAVASATIGLARQGVPATERDRPAAGTLIATRLPSDDATIALGERGVRPVVLRLAPSNHGEGDSGFVPHLIRTARRAGFSGYPGDGSSRWSAVHVRDTARLFRTALETGCSGILHSVAEEGITLRAIAEAVGRHLEVPVGPVEIDRVDDHFGFLGAFLKSDSPTSSALTREWTGWAPTEVGLLEDLGKGHYFA